MWTYTDNAEARLDGWHITVCGIWPQWHMFQSFEDALVHVQACAAEGSELHIRALQHLALCRLLNSNPAPKD